MLRIGNRSSIGDYPYLLPCLIRRADASTRVSMNSTWQLSARALPQFMQVG